MGIWTKLTAAIGSGTGAMVDWISAALGCTRDPAEKRQVAFSIAMVGLSAKMAKADGVVTRDEVEAFQRLFTFPASERRNVERLFDLARRDVAGFEAYAGRIASLYPPGDAILTDIIDCLFDIAKADRLVHEAELVFIEEVARRFGIGEAAFERIKARHVVPDGGDPYAVLGLTRGMPLAEMRKRYRQLVRDNHPDRMVARGVPQEFVAKATERLAAINVAWGRVEADFQGA